MKNTIKKSGWIAAVLIAGLLQVSATTWKNISNYSQITSLALRGSEVWVSAKGGLMMYDKNTGHTTFFKKGMNELPSLSVERVAVHALTNDIWIGTYDNGIARFNGSSWTQISLPEPKAILYEMKIAQDGAVWVLTNAGLYRYQNNQFNTYLPSALNSADACWDFDFLPGGKILCARTQPFILDPANNSVQVVPSSGLAYSDSRVLAIDDTHFAFASDHGDLCLFTDSTETDTFHFASMVVDLQMRNGNLIVLTQNENMLFEKTNNGWVTIPTGNGALSAFLIDNNEIWSGSGNGQARLFHADAQYAINEVDIRQHELGGNQVKHIGITADRHVLITHDNGIQRFDISANAFTNEWKTNIPHVYFNEAIELNGKIYAGTNLQYLYEFVSADSFRVLGSGILPGTQVLHLTRDPSGNLWLCGPGYVAKYDGNSFTIFNSTNNPNLTSNLYLRDIHYDYTRNVVWVASYDGIFKIENGVMSFFNENTPGIQQYYDAVNVITEDHRNNIWFGTVYGAVLKYDGSSFSTLVLPETAGNQFVSGIAFLGDAMYVSDNLNGIWKYENGTWDSLNTHNSAISSDYVSALFADAKGNLWIGNPFYGLDVYNKNGIALSVDEQQKNEIVARLFPNPSNGKFELQLLNADEADVKVFSIDGKLVEQLYDKAQVFTLDLSSQPSGMYFVHVNTVNGRSLIKAIRY